MEERDNVSPIGNEPAENAAPADMPGIADTGSSVINEPLKQTQTVISSVPVNSTDNYGTANTTSSPYGSSVNPSAQSNAPVNNTAQSNTYGTANTASSPYGSSVDPSAQSNASVNNAAQSNTYGTANTTSSPYGSSANPSAQSNASVNNTAQSNSYGTQQSSQTNTAQQTTPPPSQNVRKPVYDKFMYEPIGFAGYDTRAHIPPENPYGTIAEMYNSGEDEEPEKVDDKIAYKLVAGLIACCLLVSVIGIIYDVANSNKAMKQFKATGPVVLYSEKKPESAKEFDEYKDEDGRYTTEGVAKLVRPSIVEIYTYSDPAHKDLVGTGSGIVISKDGYIVTNAHVLESDGYHLIQTLDEENYSATIVGRDVKTDIAVIKVNANNLTPATFGDSDESVVGEQVVAIGNPANLSSTVTDGIISAINRKIRSDSTGFQMDCIQTNADISPGNSGGALVNMYGQVIGITSSKYVSSMVEGLGFAITINEAKPIIEELLDSGFIAGRFRIGITLIDMSSASKRASIEEAIKMELPENFKGVYIQSIDKDCDIAKTKLKEGDFITEIDGTKVSTYDELYEAISGKFEAGDTVPAKCAHLEKSGISYYEIEFKLMEDTSGNY